MNLIPPSLSRAVAHQTLMLSKNSPQLLLGVGVVGMIGSTVLACRSTLKLEDVVKKTQDELDLARSSVGKELTSGGTYTSEHSKRDIAVIYIRGLGNMTKLYAPAIILGGVSIFALTKSHSILQQRNAALTAAYMTIDSAFKAYRQRVRDELGEEKDLQFRHGSEEVQVINETTGKMVTEQRVGPGEPSQYAKFFDQFSDRWSKVPEYNLIYLSNKQNYWNDLLNTRGFVFLNEVYVDLGLPHTRAGSVVGWVSKGKGSTGDGYIDFGIFRDDQTVRNFVNGRENAILLDFNVDGPVYHLVENPEEKLTWQA